MKNLRQIPVQAVSLVPNLLRNKNLAQIDRHINRPRLPGRQPRKRRFDELISPADTQLQNRQLLAAIPLQKSLQTLPAVSLGYKISVQRHMDLHGPAADRTMRNQLRKDFPVPLCFRHPSGQTGPGVNLLMAAGSALHGQPVALHLINLLRRESAHFEMALSVGSNDKVLLFADYFFQIRHHRCFPVFSAVMTDQAGPEAPLFLFRGPFRAHALEDAPETVLPLQISEHFIKSLIVRKQVKPFRNGQAVAGADQNGVRLPDFFCDFSVCGHADTSPAAGRCSACAAARSTRPISPVITMPLSSISFGRKAYLSFTAI